MFWLVQENFKDEPKYQELIDALVRQDIPYATFKSIPFSGVMEPDYNPEGNVILMGATSLKNLCRERGFLPGYIDQNLDQSIFLEKYGERMLNKAAKVCDFDKVEKQEYDNFFLRPVLDGKQFSGMKLTWAQYVDWRDRVVALNGEENSFASLKPGDRVLYGPLVNIHEEYRFFVIDGKVITGSRYKRGGKIQYDAHVDDFIREYAQECCDIWVPNKAFTLDIAVIDKPEGTPPKEALAIIEGNSVNSSGMYQCDMGKVVAALEEVKW